MIKREKMLNLIILGIVLILSVYFSNSCNFFIRERQRKSIFNDHNLLISAVSGKIHINNNWSAAEAAGICTGNGTYSNPYVIEDLVIDGEGSGNCILIENSDVHFIIENCTTYNSGTIFPDNSGIRLLQVNNSQLIENNCTTNYVGISLNYINNSTISGNILKNNNYYGIDFRYGDNNNITGNTANNNRDGIRVNNGDINNIIGNTADNNSRDGIELIESNDNVISGNTANNNSRNGINVSERSYNNIVSGNIACGNYEGLSVSWYSENTTLSGNLAKYNFIGINLERSINTTLSGNVMVNSGLRIYGSFSYLSTHNIDTTNLVNGKLLYYYTDDLNLGPNNFTNPGQLILVNCNESLISNLNLSQCYSGISLFYCNNNNITGNTVNNNTFCGIYFSESSSNNITGNIANSNENGIYLDNCDSNNIIINTANYNYYGIFASSCIDNTISGNHASGNSEAGITLDHCYNSIVSGNNVNHNNFMGLYITMDSYITVSDNIINNNGWGIRLWFSDNIKVSGNIMNNCGVDRIGGTPEDLSSLDIDITNLVDGKPLYYFTNELNLEGTNLNNSGQVIFANFREITISNINISHNRGISLYECNNNTITGIIINNNYENIYFRNCDNNTISRNIIKNTGFFYMGCKNNSIFFNNLINVTGVYFYGPNLCDFSSLRKLTYIYKNQTYSNYLGNYWDNYNGTDDNNDGIGDTPFIMGEVVDNYPLMEPIENYEIIHPEHSEEEPIIPGYNLIFLLVVLSLVAITLSKKFKNY